MGQSSNGAARRDDLERQIQDLQADIAGISRTLSEMGAAKGEAFRNGAERQAADLRARGEDALSALRDSGIDLGHQASDAIREKPARAMGIAVGVGFLVGLLAGRR
ncbi:hypothetical protein RGUI_2070 [Rhodovulum sp. P5]|uniref:DUF883 family protein n=1 Tax=Rhodovulum sp. P5 TaxID=1564506 RepID=UPI0009C1DAFB|nr:DUF883 family protein [Rhodovulum sp. P5]ARE40211.1 hypothetical protein RGUI_2070 [Rhodovulum sp. P5]